MPINCGTNHQTASGNDPICSFRHSLIQSLLHPTLWPLINLLHCITFHSFIVTCFFHLFELVHPLPSTWLHVYIRLFSLFPYLRYNLQLDCFFLKVTQNCIYLFTFHWMFIFLHSSSFLYYFIPSSLSFFFISSHLCLVFSCLLYLLSFPVVLATLYIFSLFMVYWYLYLYFLQKGNLKLRARLAIVSIFGKIYLRNYWGIQHVYMYTNATFTVRYHMSDVMYCFYDQESSLTYFTIYV